MLTFTKHMRSSASVLYLTMPRLQCRRSWYLLKARLITLHSTHPGQKSLTYSLVSNLIVGCGLPVSIVDSPYFRAFVRDLDPKYAVPCRQAVSSVILPDLLKAKKEKLQRFLNACTDVALTTNIWMDRRAHAFFGMTVHGFQAGADVTHLLAFKAFHGLHMGQRDCQCHGSCHSRQQFAVESAVHCN